MEGSVSGFRFPVSGLDRIGLSATVSPLETVAGFLVGPGRDCRIAEVTQRKPARIEVFSPLRDRAYPPAGYTASRMLVELGTFVGQKRTTLIFTNTRSGAEHIGVRLKQLMPALANQIEVHHASLDCTPRIVAAALAVTSPADGGVCTVGHRTRRLRRT